jgi:predicted  nucleic acid-binding Zn-ribbon protein
MTENELLSLKREIDDAKEKNLQLKGQLEALLQQLKDGFGCETVEQANKKVKSLEKQITDLSNEIETGMQELEEKHFKDDDN